MYTCPINPDHKRFFARFQESVCRYIDPSGDAGDDVKNSLEGEGQVSDTWCYDCSLTSHGVVVADENNPLEDYAACVPTECVDCTESLDVSGRSPSDPSRCISCGSATGAANRSQ